MVVEISTCMIWSRAKLRQRSAKRERREELQSLVQMSSGKHGTNRKYEGLYLCRERHWPVLLLTLRLRPTAG